MNGIMIPWCWLTPCTKEKVLQTANKGELLMTTQIDHSKARVRIEAYIKELASQIMELLSEVTCKGEGLQ
jgi:hypothetical protein